MRYFNYLLLFFALFLMSCKKERVKFESIPAITENGINAVIEIPAGTNHKAEYNYDSGDFEVEIRNGKKRVVDFVPYVGNYGFIPSTYMDPKIGGDGDALDILVISESVPSGTVMEVIPIATLELIDGKEIDTKLVGIPVDTTLRVMDATDFMTFTVKYNAAQQIIQNWFLNYKGPGIMEMKGWKDERHAMSQVKKWLVEKEEKKK